jgi:TolB-like protein/cytochrome c-type biogenesis protein CcmH/NrfG
MLAGEPPFTGPSAVAVLARKSMGAPPPVSAIRDNVPNRVERAIDRALARVPADRFGSVAELAAALGDGSDPVPVRRPGRARKPLAWVGGLAVVLAAAVVISLALPRGSPPSAPWTLAVLYFDNLSPDTADAYLADGLTEEVSSRLARIGRLQVKSRQAVRRYRGAEVDLATVARALGVGYLVEGSVRRAGDRVRTSVHLVDAGTGFRVWSDDYDRAASDLLSLQADIAEHVAIQIAGRLLPDEAAALADRPTDNPEAYDRFLRGNYHLTQRSPSAVARAITEYESALRFDPHFTPALARAAYGYALYLDWGWGYPGLPRDSLLSRGVAASERALARDSTSADAWMAHGYMLVHRRPRTLSGAPAAFERALALDPTNAEAWHQYGSTLYYLGRDSSAFAALDHALEIEPERPGTWLLVAAMRFQGRRFTEAVRALDSALAHDPSMDVAYALRALARIRLGDRMGALDDARSARRIAEDPVFAETTLGVVEVAFGDTVAARERIESVAAAALEQERVSVEAGIFLASALTAVGDHRRALEVLDRVQPRGAHLFMDMRSPDLDPLRGLPRFERIAAEAQPPQ